MNDAISRQAVLDLIEHYNSDGLGSVFYGYQEGVKFADAVNKLPSVNLQEPKTDWIPVSERLPENRVNVLFCDIDGDVMIGHHREGLPRTHFTQSGTWDCMKNVRAWMSLPEPYKAESEDDE